MKHTFATRLIVLLGMISFLFGSGVALSSVPSSSDSVAFMEGPFAHAMQQSEVDGAMDDCDQQKTDSKCCDCKMTQCSQAGTPIAFIPHSAVDFGDKTGNLFGQGLEDSFSGLNRHNLPLPPP